MVTCPKCGKTMQLRNYRYKREKTCSGAIENKPIKPKAKPKARTETIKEEVEAPRELPPWKQKPTMNEVLENSPRSSTAVNPLNSLAITSYYNRNTSSKSKKNTTAYVKACSVPNPRKDENRII